MGDVKPKKHLGQHFLKDAFTVERIAGSLSPDHDVKNVLEIGPGKGILSEYLLRDKNLNCKFVELDPEAAEYFKRRFPEAADRIIQADFLKMDLKSLFDGPFLIIGNFPYNISTQILFKVLEDRDLVPELVGMFQKEVADRICSGPGSKIYGLTSVLLQTFYSCENLFDVSPELFDPPPKVISSVIRLRRNGFNMDDTLYFRLVKSAFNQRRKTLRNAIKQFTQDAAMGSIPYLDKRAEQLSTSEFLEIHTALQKLV